MDPAGIDLYPCPAMRARLTVTACERNRELARRALEGAGKRIGGQRIGLLQAEVCPGCPGVLALSAGARPKRLTTVDLIEPTEIDDRRRWSCIRPNSIGESRRARSGWGRLTPRQRQIWHMRATGLKGQEIAARLGVTSQAVYSSLTATRKKRALAEASGLDPNAL